VGRYAASEIVKDGRLPRQATVASLAQWLGLIRVDKGYAMTTDPAEPLIVVQHPKAGRIPIDGWHRVYKAWKTGQDTMLFYLLDEAEEEQVRVDPARFARSRSAGRQPGEPDAGPVAEL
jgi:hypothetical protein